MIFDSESPNYIPKKEIAMLQKDFCIFPFPISSESINILLLAGHVRCRN